MQDTVDGFAGSLCAFDDIMKERGGGRSDFAGELGDGRALGEEGSGRQEVGHFEEPSDFGVKAAGRFIGGVVATI